MILDQGTIVLIIIVVLVVGFVVYRLKRLKATELGIIMIRDQPSRAVGPGGWQFIPPVIGSLLYDDAAERPLDLGPQVFSVKGTEDRAVEVGLRVATSVWIKDPMKALLTKEPIGILARSILDAVRTAMNASHLNDVQDPGHKAQIKRWARDGYGDEPGYLEAADRLGLGVGPLLVEDADLPEGLSAAILDAHEAEYRAQARERDAEGHSLAVKKVLDALGGNTDAFARWQDAQVVRDADHPIVVLGGGGGDQGFGTLVALLSRFFGGSNGPTGGAR